MLLSSIPISAIRAFEAAARTGSFSDAADELHLTPSAVSHAIRKLESTMSTTLFERSAPFRAANTRWRESDASRRCRLR